MTVRNLPGNVLAVVAPVPPDVVALKAAIEEQTGCPAGLQRLVEFGGTRIYGDTDKLVEGADILMVVDESPMWQWDWERNPGRHMLEVDGATVKCPKLQTDYCNVLTREPMRSGSHYYQFVMHMIGDEQWCGVVQDSSQAGSRFSGRSLKAWTYYCGRMGSSYSSIVDGLGGLHAGGRAVKQFKKLQPSGDVIGMLVDLDHGAIAFDLNGELQGACAIPKGPLWVITHVDQACDHVELRKPSLQDAPPSNLAALRGALQDVSSGVLLNQYSEFAYAGADDDDAKSNGSDAGDVEGPADALD